MNRSTNVVQRKSTKLASSKPKFLAAVRKYGSIIRSCEILDIPRSYHYDHWMLDESYQSEFKKAMADAVDAMEAEARRRAMEGEEKTVYNKQGDVIDTIHEKSDTLLIFLLKGAKPDKYRERFELPAVPLGGNIVNNVQINVSGLPEEKLREFTELSAKLLLDVRPAEGSPPSGNAGAGQKVPG